MLSDDGLSVRTTATNVGAERMPVRQRRASVPDAWNRDGRRADDCKCRHERFFAPTSAAFPSERTIVEGTDYDFRRARPIGATKLDTAFTSSSTRRRRLTRVELRELRSGDRLTLWVDESYRYLMIFTGDPLPDVNRRAIAVEPMTCPPNAFRSGTDLITLEPGASWTGAWGMRATTRS